ncbi:MAG TPA: hypothetical protein VK208_02250 [Pyrinomonadaceae bacterium]|jgi:hypothetical protein|nr:hypothetical protein [Pyrinomonadaceae bacterium]
MYDFSMTTFIKLALFASLLSFTGNADCKDRFAGCLPDGISLDSPVVVEPPTSGKQMAPAKLNVRARLIKLKAHCKRGKLLDGKNRQIYFYSLIGCWGNPPENYLELLQHQTEEVQRLKRKFTVIQIPCGDNIDPRKIS